MNIIFVQSSLLLVLSILQIPEISAKKSKIKIIVPHKIKYVHHHHTHVLVVKEKKKPHKEPQHHLHYHHEDGRKKKKKVKHHYYIPYIPHGDEEEGAEETMAEYSVTLPVNSAYQPTRSPLLPYDERQYDVIGQSGSRYPPYTGGGFYDRNSEELIGSESKNEYYETDPYFKTLYSHLTPPRLPDKMQKGKAPRREIEFVTEPTTNHFATPKPTGINSYHFTTQYDKSFRPITPSYEIYNGPDLFYPTKPTAYGLRSKRS